MSCRAPRPDGMCRGRRQLVDLPITNVWKLYRSLSGRSQCWWLSPSPRCHAARRRNPFGAPLRSSCTRKTTVVGASTRSAARASKRRVLRLIPFRGELIRARRESDGRRRGRWADGSSHVAPSPREVHVELRRGDASSFVYRLLHYDFSAFRRTSSKGGPKVRADVEKSTLTVASHVGYFPPYSRNLWVRK